MMSETLIGRKLGERYLVRRLVGEGGMGIVYEAENVHVGKIVALKVLSPELAAAPEHLARFQREARAAAAIGHPNIIEVYDFGLEDPRLAYFVMELLDGESLGQVIEAEGRLRVKRAVHIAGQTLDALGAAHRAGIVHRDVKPDNIFLCSKARGAWEERLSRTAPRETVKVLDFGISMFHGAAADPQRAGQTPIRQIKLTKTGAILGTPWYMAPEQAAGHGAVDQRADIYAVGAVLYHMLAGRPPFDGKTAIEVLYKVLTDSPKPLAKVSRGVPKALCGLVDRALAKAPADRFQTAESFLDALGPFARDPESEIEAPDEVAPEAVRAPVRWPSTIPASGPADAASRSPDPSGRSRQSRAQPATLTPDATDRIPRTGAGDSALGLPTFLTRRRRLPRIAAAGAAAAAAVVLLVVWIGGSDDRSATAPPAEDGAIVAVPAAPGVAKRPADTPVVGGQRSLVSVAAPGVAERPSDTASRSPDPTPDARPPTLDHRPPIPDPQPPNASASLVVFGTAGAVLTLDGEAAGTVPATVRVPADGAAHVLRASKRGRQSGRWEIGPFAPGESGRLEVRLRATATQESAAAETAEPAAQPRDVATSPELGIRRTRGDAGR